MRDLPILLVMNHFILLYHTNETEFLYVHFGMMKNGATIDMIAKNLGGDRGLYFYE